MRNIFTTLTVCAASALCSGSIALAAQNSDMSANNQSSANLTPEQQNLFINSQTGELVRVSPDGTQATPVTVEELATIFPNQEQLPATTTQGLVDDLAFRGGGHGGFGGGRGGFGGGRGGFGGGRGGWGRGGWGRGGYGRGGWRGGRGGYWYPYQPCNPYYDPYYSCY